MKLRLIIKAILLWSFLMANTAFANTIKIDLTGSVTRLGGRPILLAESRGEHVSSFIDIGDTISYSFIFTETDSGVVGMFGHYLDAVTEFNANAGSYKFSGLSGIVNINNNVGGGRGGEPWDEFILSFGEADFLATDGSVGFNSDDGSISLDPLVATTPLTLVTIKGIFDTALFDNVGLTEETVKLAFNDLSLMLFTMEFGGVGARGLFTVDGEFDSITTTDLTAVPLPAALWLFCSGFLGLLGLRAKDVGGRYLSKT